jgi:hypothetical protein
MNRRLSALWIPLLAVLLARPPVPQWPQAWSPETAVAHAGLLATPAKAVLPGIRLQRAFPFRSPTDRQGSLLGAVVPLRHATGTGISQVIVRITQSLSATPAESARHYPLFPTGPPSHG